MIWWLIVKAANKVKIPSFLHGLLYVRLWWPFWCHAILNYTHLHRRATVKETQRWQSTWVFVNALCRSINRPPLAQVIRSCLFAGTYKVQKIRNMWALMSFLLGASEWKLLVKMCCWSRVSAQRFSPILIFCCSLATRLEKSLFCMPDLIRTWQSPADYVQTSSLGGVQEGHLIMRMVVINISTMWLWNGEKGGRKSETTPWLEEMAKSHIVPYNNKNVLVFFEVITA